jgi:hypothetical protein
VSPRRSLPSLVAVLALAAPAAAQSPVSVDPVVGTPDTAFQVSVPAAFPIRQIRDRYWFILQGPGGRECEGTVTDRVGITPPKRARQVGVALPGVRVVSRREVVPGPWCPGVFQGRVEFWDWRPRARRFVHRKLGTFSVEVRPASS